MDLRHLAAFLDNDDFKFYMLSFFHNGTVEISASNGYVLVTNTLPAKHNLNGVLIGIVPEDINKLMLFINDVMEFNYFADGKYYVGVGPMMFPLTTVHHDKLPNLRKVFNFSFVNKMVTATFTTENYFRVMEYIEAVGDTNFDMYFTGINHPIIMVGEKFPWRIYLMPLGYKENELNNSPPI